MTLTAEEAYEQICYYTLSLQDEDFIHQHVVDAYAAQTVTHTDKPIRLFFALVGLFLHVEKGFNGRQIQKAHMQIARSKYTWPRFERPTDRGAITAIGVAKTNPGTGRNETIERWCRAVWQQYSHTRPVLEAFLKDKLVIE
jgi:hypothetical protein